MTSVLLVAAEITALFFISQALIKTLFRLLDRIFRNRMVSVSFITAILFPGTVIHELSHLFTAEVLGVRTGTLSLIPEPLGNGEIKTGSVMIQKTDPFRRYIIGLAPTFVGLPTLMALAWWIHLLVPQVTAVIQAGTVFTEAPIYLLALAGYLVFVISNSMFSSAQDLKDFLPFAMTVILFVLAGYLTGIRIELSGIALRVVAQIVITLSKSLAVVLALNIILLLFTQMILKIFQPKAQPYRPFARSI